MKRLLVGISVLLLVMGTAYSQAGNGAKGSTQPDPAACPFPDESGAGQSQTGEKQAEQPKGQMVMCPMMETMSKMQPAQMAGSMEHMRQGMARMFSPSAEEIRSLLNEKRATLGLNEKQVAEIADAIASFQEKKAHESMEQMMGQMGAKGWKCPCMGTSSN